MKLYVWEGVLYDYTSGIMFALANSEEEARELILKKNPHSTQVQRDLVAKPDVYDEPMGFMLWGGG